MSKVCENKHETRCCHRDFCKITRELMTETTREKYLFDQNAEIPFMGEHGCRVPPEHRPGCTGYLCPEATKGDQGRKYRKLCRLAGVPYIPRDGYSMDLI